MSKLNNILQLPVVALLFILKKLKLSDLRNLMLTCKAFRNLIINDNTIWRAVCRDRLVLNHITEKCQPNISWYNLCRISNNWCNGIYRSKSLIQLYSNHMPWLKFHKSEALMISLGSELSCYLVDNRGLPNCDDPQWVLNVPIVNRNDVRTNDVSRFVIKDNILVCGNRDGSGAIYKVDNIRSKPQLLYHIKNCHENGQMEVSAVEIITDDDSCYVMTVSYHSPHIQLWHATTSGSRHAVNNIMAIPIEGGEGAKCLAVNGSRDKLAVGLDGNSKPLLLDVNIGEYLMTANTTKNMKQAIRDIVWHNENVIAYVTHSGKLHLIDVRTHEVIYDTTDPFSSSLYCVKSDGNDAIVVGSSEYSRCVLFDTRKRASHVQMYFTQKRSSPVYCLDLDSTKLIAAVDRGISALNFNVNIRTAQQRDYSYVFHSQPPRAHPM